MNIKKAISVGLVASMLLPTAVSASKPLATNNGGEKSSIVSKGTENTPKIGTGDSTDTNEGEINPNTNTIYGDTSKMLFHAYIKDYEKSKDGRKILSLTKPIKKPDGLVISEMTTLSYENSLLDNRIIRVGYLLEGAYNWGSLGSGFAEDVGQSIDFTNTSEYIDNVNFDKLNKLLLRQYINDKNDYNTIKTTEYYGNMMEYKNKLISFENNIKSITSKFNESKRMEIESLNNQMNETNKQEIQDKIRKINNITIYSLLKKQNIDLDSDILDRLNQSISPIINEYGLLKKDKPELVVNFKAYPELKSYENELVDNRWCYCKAYLEGNKIATWGSARDIDTKQACLNRIDKDNVDNKEQLIRDYKLKIEKMKKEFDQLKSQRDLSIKVDPQNDELKDVDIENIIQLYNTPTNYGTIEGYRNVALFLKTSEYRTNEYALVKPGALSTSITDPENIVISNDIKNVHGIDWGNIRSIEIPQDGSKDGQNNIESINHFMALIRASEESSQLYAKLAVRYENEIKKWKDTKIANQQEIIDNEDKSEEDKKAARMEIDRIKSISLDNIETADEEIKSQIMGKEDYEFYKTCRKNSKSIPELYVIANITDKKNETKPVKIQVVVTNDNLFSQLPDNCEDIDIEVYIHQIKEKYLFARNKYNISKAKYEAEKAEYEKNIQDLNDDAKRQADKYTALREEVEKLINELYNVKSPDKSTVPAKEIPDVERVTKSITKLKQIEDYFNGKIEKLNAQNKALEEERNKLLQSNADLIKKQAAPGTLTKDKAELLESTITSLMDSIKSLNNGYNTLSIADTSVSRLLTGVKKEGTKIVPSGKPNVNIKGLIIDPITDNSGKTVTVNPKALLDYILSDEDNAVKENQIKQLMDNIESIVDSYKGIDYQLHENEKLIKDKDQEIAKLKKDYEKATAEGTLGELMAEIDKLTKENETLKINNKALNKQLQDAQAEIEKLNQLKAAELEKQVESLKAKITTLKQKLEDAEKALENFKGENTGPNNFDITKAIQNLTDQLNVAKKELNKFAGIEEALNKYDNSTNKTLLQKVEELIDKANKSGSGDSTEIKRLEAEIAKLNTEIEGLKQQLANKESSEAEINTKLSKAEGDLVKAKEDLATEKANNQKLQKQIDDLAKELNKATKAGSISKAEADRLKEKLKTANQNLEAKQNEINTKNAEIADLNQQIKDLNKTIKEKDATIAELEKQIRDITAEKDKLVSDKAGVDSRVDELTNTINDLNSKIAEKDGTIAAKDKKIAEKNTKITNLDKQVAANNATIEEKNNLIEILKGKIKTLEDQIAKLTEKLQNNNNSKIEELQNEINNLNSKISSLTAEKQALTEKNNTLTAENVQLKADKQRLEEENRKLIQDKQELERQLNELKTSNTQLLKQIAKLQDIIANLRQQNEANLAKITELTSKNTELTNKIAANESELKNLKKQLDEKTAKIQELTRENINLKNQLEELKNSTKGSQDTIDALNKEIAVLKAKVEALQQSVNILASSELSQKFIQSQKDLATAKDQLEKANLRIVDLERQLQEAKSQCKPEDNQLARKIAELERQLEASKAENTKLSQELSNLKATTDKKIAELNKQLGIKDGTISELEKKLKEKEDELNRLLEEKNNIKKENDNLKKENDKLKENANKQPETPNKEETGKIEIVPNKPEEKKPEVPGPVITNDKDFKQPEIVEDNKDKTTDNGIVNPSDNIDKQIEDTKKEIEKIKDDIKTVESGGVINSDNTIVPGNNTTDIEGHSNGGKAPEYIEESGKIDVVTPEKGATFKDSGITPTYKEKGNALNRFGEWILSNLGTRDKNLGNSKYIFPVGKSEYYVVNNGNKTSKTTDAAPFIQNGRTMFSVNEISKITGIELTWDNELKVATFNDGSHEVSVQANNVQLVTDGNKVSLMDSKPIIKNDRLFMSITNLNKAFDNKLNITWDNSDRSVVIEK